MSIKMTMGKIVSSVKSVRTRAILSLGIVLGLASVSTLAYWTDSSSLTSGTIQTGKLDIKLDGADNLPNSGKLALSAMIPGESVAATIAVQRAAGTIPFTYSVSGSVPAVNELTESLRFKLYAGTAGAQSTNTTTGLRTQGCGGTQIAGGTDGIKLVASSTSLVTGRTGLAALGLPAADLTDNLCVQAILPYNGTENAAQNKTTTVNLTFNATQLS